MTKQIELSGKLMTFPSYRKGEDFLCSMPEDPLTLDLKKNKENQLSYEFPWDPWPKEPGIVRLGRFLLKIDDKYSYLDYWKKKVYVRLIAEVDENGQPVEWMRFDWGDRGMAGNKKLKCYHGERSWESKQKKALTLTGPVEQIKEEIREEIRRWVVAENYKAGEEKYKEEDRDYWLKDEEVARRVLKTPEGEALSKAFDQVALGPFDLTEEELKAVFGEFAPHRANPKNRKDANWEFEYRELFLKVECAWARKQMMKYQQQVRRELKKQVMTERNIDEDTLIAEKAERVKMERRVKRTQEWVKVSKDVHNSIEWLQDFVQKMGNFEDIDQKWFDKNRRELRELATKMKPLSRVLNN